MHGETVTVELSEEVVAGMEELVERGYPDRAAVVREAIRRQNGTRTDGTGGPEPTESGVE